jgi:hypothetical protein
MFLCDCAEFGRKVRVGKPQKHPDNTNWYSTEGSYLSNLKIADTPAIRMSYAKYQPLREELKDIYPQLSGDTRVKTFQIRKKNGRLARIRKQRVLQNDLGADSPRVDEIRNWGESKRRSYGSKQTQQTFKKPDIKTNPKPKSSRKFLNKYTIGGLGVLGGAATAYGGYKLLTRNKNKKDK